MDGTTGRELEPLAVRMGGTTDMELGLQDLILAAPTTTTDRDIMMDIMVGPQLALDSTVAVAELNQTTTFPPDFVDYYQEMK